MKQTAIQQANKNLKQQVMQMLHWDDLQYGEFQQEMGLQYLQHTLLAGDDTWLNELSRCKIFWQWWINQWNIRDSQFMEDGTRYETTLHGVIEYYTELHSPCNLQCRPHKSIMEETYAVMMGDFIDLTMKAAC